MKKAVLRALWGFLVFIPFCWLWGVSNFTWFAFIGTLYFIPIHWMFDRLMSKPNIRCFLGLHDWRELSKKGVYPSVRECVKCKRTEESSYDFWQIEWREV